MKTYIVTYKKQVRNDYCTEDGYPTFNYIWFDGYVREFKSLKDVIEFTHKTCDVIEITNVHSVYHYTVENTGKHNPHFDNIIIIDGEEVICF